MRHSLASGGQATQGPSWGYSKVNFDRFFRKRGQFSPNVDKNGATAPRTGLGYPHEGPFVARCTLDFADVPLAREEPPVLVAVFVLGAIPVPNFLERDHPLLYDPPHLGQG